MVGVGVNKNFGNRQGQHDVCKLYLGIYASETWGNLAPLGASSLLLHHNSTSHPPVTILSYDHTHYGVMSNSDEEYTIPLQDQRAFGAGLKRKRVQFVRSSETTPATSSSAISYGHKVSKTYLGLVLPQSSGGVEEQSSKADASLAETKPQICETCSLPIPPLPSSTPHAALLAHQLSLPHSHPPSSLSPRRTGVRMLRDQGWDPNARTGLGAHGEGIRYPIKAKEKNDKLGIGATMPKPKRDVLELSRGVGQAKSRQEKENEEGKKKKGWVKKKAEEEKQRSNRLQQLFYESEEVSKYLR